MNLVPQERPALTRDQALAILNSKTSIPAILGIRGFFTEYFDSWCNERGIYDDAIFLITQTEIKTFNSNCDPSKYIDATAELGLGVWKYQVGIHGLQKDPKFRYEALIQAEAVKIHRANGISETGFFGINIHRGGMNSTGSLGCQTIYPPQWDEFISSVKLAMSNNKTIQYCLIELPNPKGTPCSASV